MKFSLNILGKPGDDADRRWPSRLFGGRVRTSTLVLIVVFLAVWWLYDTYRPHEPAYSPPPTQVVPPGFLPDPDYTWVPRTRVDEPLPTYTVPRTTVITPTTPPTTTSSLLPTTTPPPPPPFTLPCLLPPPFCPETTPPSQLPEQGPGPSPSSLPPAS